MHYFQKKEGRDKNAIRRTYTQRAMTLRTLKEDTSLHAGSIYAKSVDTSATVTKR
jgi:hypothetical protein